MSIENIIDYVIKTPNNTNPNVIRSLVKNEVDENTLQKAKEYTDAKIGSGSTVKISEGGAGYSEVEVRDIFPEQTITYDASQGAYLLNVNDIPADGTECTVVVDGVEYKVTATHDPDFGVLMGDIALLFGSSGFSSEPWCIIIKGSAAAFVRADKSTADTTLSITGSVETVYTISKKYLPSDITAGVLPIIDFTTELPSVSDGLSNMLTDEEANMVKACEKTCMPFIARFHTDDGVKLSAVALYNGVKKEFVIHFVPYSTYFSIYQQGDLAYRLIKAVDMSDLL